MIKQQQILAKMQITTKNKLIMGLFCRKKGRKGTILQI